jgi:hypothetical protein
MMDLEREQLRKTYEVGRMGFGILSAALVLACVTTLVPLLRNFYPELGARIIATAGYRWLDVPITWGSLLGVTLLWGRFDHAGWQRRVGLLLVMSLADAGLWFLDHGAALGVAQGDFGHDWLRGNLGQALGWAEFALMAALSCDYLEHLGVEYARESGKSTRSMAATGAVVWLLLFCEHTDWRGGWPLAPHRWRSIEEFLLHQASNLIWTITLLQVTSLVISAARMSGQVLAEMRFEDEVNDPFKSRSEWSKELDVYGA